MYPQKILTLGLFLSDRFAELFLYQVSAYKVLLYGDVCVWCGFLGELGHVCLFVNLLTCKILKLAFSSLETDPHHRLATKLV